MSDESDSRYFARSASDKTDDWPFWFVADRSKGGLNVTAELVRKLYGGSYSGGTLCSRAFAETVADMANDKERTK